jgi:hypothetical protein
MIRMRKWGMAKGPVNSEKEILPRSRGMLGPPISTAVYKRSARYQCSPLGD